MLLLIDGYNLLNASDVFPSADGPPTFERARQALLDFLSEALEPRLLARTLIVFDAASAPPGLPAELQHRGLAVRFARRGTTADELLEELIAAAPDPRHLLVVSSDHQVQRAARQNGAQFVDSEDWYSQIRRTLASRRAQQGPDAADREPALDNPFPPGYADDLLE